MFIGEAGLNAKVKKMGYKFAYVGSSLTYHMIPAERLTMQYMKKRFANLGNSDSYTDYRTHRYSSGRLWFRMTGHIRRILINSLHMVVKRAVFWDAWREHRINISYNASRMKYNLRLIRDEKWREMVLKDDWLEPDEN